MRTNTVWNQQMQFTADAAGQTVSMDAKAPLGKGSAPTPKELLLAAISGCTGMDVAALMKKHKQEMVSFSISADADSIEGRHPVIFREVRLEFNLKGRIDPAIALESVRLSQTRFCGVSAMVAATVPIRYTVRVNEELVGSGMANFEGEKST